MEHILKPADTLEVEECLAPEDLARLAEGLVEPHEREAYLRHLAHCSEDYEILKQTLIDLAEEEAEELSEPTPWITRRQVYALAASFLFMVLIGGGLFFKHLQKTQTLVASVALDAKLQSLLMEDKSLTWKGEKVNRLTALLRERGVAVKEAQKVVLLAAYRPPVVKSLFGPKEVLKIRIEDKVVYLEVVKEGTQNKPDQ
jgi:hypothetical protein